MSPDNLSRERVRWWIDRADINRLRVQANAAWRRLVALRNPEADEERGSR